MSQEISFSYDIYNSYENYREPSLNCRRIKHADILPLIEKLRHNSKFVVHKLGESVEKRELFLLKIGTGKTKIFLWSQMHGDESTATMALFDIFNFFSANDNLNGIREKILSEATLYFLPMVNPDGAEIFQRRNIWEIDLNRDASRLITPEADILMNTFDTLKADFGFNLHDQSTKYSVGRNYKQATISFLAPAFNEQKDLSQNREKAIKLIGMMNQILQQFIPGHVAKYSDDYEPRAFGDTFQKKGTSTILIESGGWKDDIEKQFVRKINFIGMMSAFLSIANNTYVEMPTDNYDAVPMNDKFLFDLLLTNILVKKNDQHIPVDVAINVTEQNLDSSSAFTSFGLIEDIGDLSIFHGIDEMDCSGLTLREAKVYAKEVETEKEFSEINFQKLVEDGIGYLPVQKTLLHSKNRSHLHEKFPVCFVDDADYQFKLKIGEQPAFYLYKNDTPKYVVLGGKIIRLHNTK
ncbi:MAG: M14 family metallopeptidase [Ignavibacteria bacterium]|nr:M14 family metallopeptidase [Ignavibacteria bacterium]